MFLLQSTLFQDDIFPPTKEPVPSMTAEEWIGGANTPCNKVSMKEGFVTEKRTVKTGGLNKGLGKGLNASKPAAAAKPVDDTPKGEAAVSTCHLDISDCAHRFVSHSLYSGYLHMCARQLLKAYHEHVAEIKELKAKLAALEA